MSSQATVPIAHEVSVLVSTERFLLIGALLSHIAYGIHLILFLQCFNLLLRDRKKRRSTYFFISFTLTGFILGTLYIASVSVITQYTFVDYARITGGPVAFYQGDFKQPTQLMSTFTAIISNWMTDGLLLWRGFAVYRGSRWVYIMVLPTLVYLGSISMAICLLVQIFHPSIALISRLNVQLPYTSLSLSLNILIPVLISVQILSKKKRIASALGPQYADQYTSIIAMIVESAAPDFVFAVPYLILFGSKNPAQNILVSSLTQIEFIMALLIISRVARGRAWSSQTTTALSRTLGSSRHAPLPINIIVTTSSFTQGNAVGSNLNHDSESMQKVDLKLNP